MKTYAILSALLLVATSTLAHAGGPPPLYVVVDKVVMDVSKGPAHSVQIWGSFTRMEKINADSGKTMYAFTKPTYGYVYLSIADANDRHVQEELQDWQKAAGTKQAVAVGSCGDAGTMLKTPIHQPGDKVSQPDMAYSTGYLKVFGNLYADDQLKQLPEVAALLKFTQERK